VDDDQYLLRLLADRLRRDGFAVTVAGTGTEALRTLDDAWPDLVVLDLMLPDQDGDAVAAAVKERADLPIIVLSAVDDTTARTVRIERFAEDYLTKPFHYPELRARVDRVLNRLRDQIPTQQHVVGPDLRLDLGRRVAIVGGKVVKLTPIETRLLAALVAGKGKPVTTDRLLHLVWGTTEGAEPVYVWVTVHRLRQKLERDPQQPRYLHSQRGGGYCLGASAPSSA